MVFADFCGANTPPMAGYQCEVTQHRVGRNALPSLYEPQAPAHTVPGPTQQILTIKLDASRGYTKMPLLALM